MQKNVKMSLKGKPFSKWANEQLKKIGLRGYSDAALELRTCI